MDLCLVLVFFVLCGGLYGGLGVWVAVWVMETPFVCVTVVSHENKTVWGMRWKVHDILEVFCNACCKGRAWCALEG